MTTDCYVAYLLTMKSKGRNFKLLRHMAELKHGPASELLTIPIALLRATEHRKSGIWDESFLRISQSSLCHYNTIFQYYTWFVHTFKAHLPGNKLCQPGMRLHTIVCDFHLESIKYLQAYSSKSRLVYCTWHIPITQEGLTFYSLIIRIFKASAHLARMWSVQLCQQTSLE